MSERIAIFADTHANYAATSAVLADIHAQRVNAVWCLGDMIGRGPEPIPTLIRLRQVYLQQEPHDQAAWLVGNHELMILEKVLTGQFEDTVVGGNGPLATLMAEHHRRDLNQYMQVDKLKAFLNRLHPYAAEPPRPGIYVAHAHYALREDGNVDEVKAYSQTGNGDAHTSSALRNLMAGLAGEDQALRMIITAHTHVSGLWQWNPDTKTADPVPNHLAGIHTFTALSARPIYVNPGSAGFPRLPDGRPSYVVLTLDDDPETASVEFRQVTYDRDEIVWPSGYPNLYRKEIERTSRSGKQVFTRKIDLDSEIKS